jgi:hypothetical protein
MVQPDEEDIGFIGRFQAGAGGDVQLLGEDLFELDLGWIAERCETAAAGVIDNDVGFTADEDATGHTDQLDAAAVDGGIFFEGIVAARADRLAEQTRDIEEHGHTSRSAVLRV